MQHPLARSLERRWPCWCRAPQAEEEMLAALRATDPGALLRSLCRHMDRVTLRAAVEGALAETAGAGGGRGRRQLALAGPVSNHHGSELALLRQQSVLVWSHDCQ